MAFRLFSELDTFHGLTGQLVAGGYLKTYEAGTTTPAATYGDEALTVNNGVTITLDSSGRPSVDMWGDTGASYFVELYDADDVKQGEADDVQDPAGTATSIPALSGNTGKYLTNNGSVLLWGAIREVPDPTGQSGKVLGNDGTDLAWQALPTPAEPEITVGAASFQAGVSTDATKHLTQYGTGTAPANPSGVTTSVAITFPTAFATLNHVDVTPTIASVSGTGAIPVNAVTGFTPGSAATGCTVNFRNPTDGDIVDSGDYITSAVTFTWAAHGTVEVP